MANTIKTCHVQSEICDQAIPRFNCKICSNPVCKRCCSRRLLEGHRSIICNDCQIKIEGNDRRVRARIARVKAGFRGEALDLQGQMFGSLFVEKQHGRTAAGDVIWWVRCVCGNELPVKATLLKNGKKRSCGCQPGDQARHGKRGKRIYYIWQWLKQSGQLAEVWHSFPRFYSAVGDPPGEDMTLAPLTRGGQVGPKGFYWVVSGRRLRRRLNRKRAKRDSKKPPLWWVGSSGESGSAAGPQPAHFLDRRPGGEFQLPR